MLAAEIREVAQDGLGAGRVVGSRRGVSLHWAESVLKSAVQGHVHGVPQATGLYAWSGYIIARVHSTSGKLLKTRRADMCGQR